MPPYVQRFIRWLLIVLLVVLPWISSDPQQQNIAAITPASTMTLVGQQLTDQPIATRTDETPAQQDQTTQHDEQQNEPQSEKQTAQQREEVTPNEAPQQPQTSAQASTATATNDVASTPPTKAPASSQPPAANNADAPKQPDRTELVMTDDAEDATAYFDTNLRDGQTVTTESYTLAVTHVNRDVTVKQTSVTLNDVTLAQNDWTLTFTKGENIVTVVVTYVNDAGNELRAKAIYHVTFNDTQTIIQTTLATATTDDETIRFSAFAERAGEHVPVTVTLNGEVLEATSGRAYKAALTVGANTFTLVADDVQETYVVTRTEQISSIVVTTDLHDQKVSKASFAFHAVATQHDNTMPITITLNGQQIDGDENYEVTLQRGTNTIALHATDGTEVVTQQYHILYSDPTATTEKPIDALAPTLKTDLVDGTQVKGLIKTINVWPTTAAGTRIHGKDVAVTVNGVGVPFVWDDAEKTSYKLTLQHGANDVTIRAWDADGRVVKQQFTVHAEDAKGGVIGQVTMSVEGSVLGIPYFIPPTKVDVHQGEKGSYVLDQLLRNYGFTYRATGTLDTNFYLAAIEKQNMLQGLHIPDDLWALVEEASTRASKDDYNMHALGEFDFANGAGWMFSVNGDYPNYGFSDAYFLDGDVVRVRYTLHYGRDINGFGANGVGATSTESGSNWEKEW